MFGDSDGMSLRLCQRSVVTTAKPGDAIREIPVPIRGSQARLFCFY
jgi:hypothetical protein